MAEIKRLNYFTYQFLVAKDFQDEQAYHREMRWRHNRLLHSPGVAEGLDVTKTGDKQVTVSAGAAIDREGREIVLPADPAPAPVSLSAFAANSVVHLVISFAAVFHPDDRYTAGGVDDFIRTTERPSLTAQSQVPPVDGSVIPLARITLDVSGNVSAVDNSIRTMAGSIKPDIRLRSLALINSQPENQWPRLTSNAANNTLLTGSLQLQGPGNLTVAGALAAQANATVNGVLTVGTNLTVGQRIGVGTAAPSEKLQIEAGSIFLNGESQGLIVDSAGAKRVGLIKYVNKEGGIWRLNNQDFEIGRVNPQVTALPGAPTAFTTDLYIAANGDIGTGTDNPQGRLHLFSPANPTVLRVQSGASFGAGRLEFWSDPQGGANEWRPGAIQSTDNGNFTGGLAFFVNGAGAANKTGLTEVMRIVNGNVGIGNSTPTAKLEVAGSIRSTMWNVFEVFDQEIGPLPKSKQITTNGGTLLIFACGSGFLGTGQIGQLGMEVLIDNVVRTRARSTTNEALSHKAFTAAASVVGGIAAGQHTVLVRVMGSTVTDGNDFFTVTILELPWVTSSIIFTPPIFIPPINL